MTPIDNAVLSEMLDNALSDIKYLRQEVSALREAKAEAKAEAYELREELDSRDEELRQALRASTEAHTKAKGTIEALRKEHRELQADAREASADKYDALRDWAWAQDEADYDRAVIEKQAERIAELREELAEAEDIISGLRAELSSAKTAAHAAIAGNREADERITELEDTVTQLVTERDTVVAERITKLEDRLDAAHAVRSDLECEVTELEEALARAVSRGLNVTGSGRERLATAHAKLYDTECEVTELREALRLSKAAEQAWADKYGRLADIRDVALHHQGRAHAADKEVERLQDEVERLTEALRLSVRETYDLEQQLGLYAENCECSQ